MADAGDAGNCGKHIHLVVLRSPEADGLDETNTLKDFRDVLDWAGQNDFEGLCEHCVLKLGGEARALSPDQRKGMLVYAFHKAFHHLQDSVSPEMPEMLIWYYTGHGKTEASNDSPIPCLDILGLDQDYLSEINEKDKEHFDDIFGKSQVQGGEMILGDDYGCCNLRGLLRHWIWAIESRTINKKPNEKTEKPEENPKPEEKTQKENKHLVIVADSCRSGMLAKDLNTLKDKSGPWKKKGCCVTLQAACSTHEVTGGQIFTPTFVYLQRRPDVLRDLKKEWERKSNKDKASYMDRACISPTVVSTQEEDISPKSPTFEVTCQGVSITLFRERGFFKYCYNEVHNMKENCALRRHNNLTRVLDSDSAERFLSRETFIVIAYKLKTISTGEYDGYPMGMFLMEYKNDTNCSIAVCAHVLFAKGDTSRVGKIDLFHHLNSGTGVEFETEDAAGLSNTQTRKPIARLDDCENPRDNVPEDWYYWKWQAISPQSLGDLAKVECQKSVNGNEKWKELENAMEMLTTCYEFVEWYNEGRWADTTQWKMRESYLKKVRTERLRYHHT